MILVSFLLYFFRGFLKIAFGLRCAVQHAMQVEFILHTFEEKKLNENQNFMSSYLYKM